MGYKRIGEEISFVYDPEGSHGVADLAVSKFLEHNPPILTGHRP